jgi:hypothetical protein
VENQKKEDGYLGDPARGQADPGSAAVYNMDWPGPMICMYVWERCPADSDPQIYLLWPERNEKDVRSDLPRCYSKYQAPSSTHILNIYYYESYSCSTYY